MPPPMASTATYLAQTSLSPYMCLHPYLLSSLKDQRSNIKHQRQPSCGLQPTPTDGEGRVRPGVAIGMDGRMDGWMDRWMAEGPEKRHLNGE